MIVCIPSPPRLLMKQDQRSLMRRWLLCSGWGMERVSLVFSYKGSRFIWKGRSCAKDNISQLPVVYPNPTINRKTRNREPEIGTDGSSPIRSNLPFDRYGSRFDPPRHCDSGLSMFLGLNWTVFPVQTRTAGGLPGLVANINPVDVDKAYGHMASRYHSPQWHVRSYGWGHASFD